MTPFKILWIKSGIFLCLAIALSWGSVILQSRAQQQGKKNQDYGSALTELQKVSTPEQYLSPLKNPLTQDPICKVKALAKQNYILLTSFEKITKNTVILTFKSPLDLDVFAYLKDLEAFFLGSLAIKELGLFRKKKSVVGKIILHFFIPQGEKNA